MELKLRLVFQTLLYIVASVVFIYGATYLFNWLRITSGRQFTAHATFIMPLFTFCISLIFSFSHIKSLFFKKVTIRIHKLITAILLLITILLRLSGHSAQFLVWQYIPVAAYGVEIIYFLFWYNLAYSFALKNRESVP